MWMNTEQLIAVPQYMVLYAMAVINEYGGIIDITDITNELSNLFTSLKQVLISSH